MVEPDADGMGMLSVAAPPWHTAIGDAPKSGDFGYERLRLVIQWDVDQISAAWTVKSPTGQMTVEYTGGN